MNIREILVAYEIKGRNKIDPDHDYAYSLQLKDLVPDNISADRELVESIERLKNPEVFMPMEIPGIHSFSRHEPETFNGYVILDSGLIVPEIVAQEARLQSKPYNPTRPLYATSSLDFILGD